MDFLKVLAEILTLVDEFAVVSNSVTVEGIRLKSLLLNDLARLED